MHISAQQYTQSNPFTATISASKRLTSLESVKDVRHIELDLSGSDIGYTPGDTLGVYFSNDNKLVHELISITGNSASDKVLIKDKECSLEHALGEKLELTLSYPGFVKAYQQATNDPALLEVLNDKVGLREFLASRQIIDIVKQFPNTIAPQPLVDALRPITPRLFSIASSQRQLANKVCLTVAHVNYHAFGFEHQGGASGYLSTRVSIGDKVKIYPVENKFFRLPADVNAPTIMVGPGTGIAPFIGFLQERKHCNASGKNWLFFGNPSSQRDHLYRDECNEYMETGLLSKLTLAFSRDQQEKLYVQHRLLEHANEVYAWLEQGAYFYVCGDAMHMAKAVEQALLEIISTCGEKSTKEAQQYLLAMRKEKRYQKDVY